MAGPGLGGRLKAALSARSAKSWAGGAPRGAGYQFSSLRPASADTIAPMLLFKKKFLPAIRSGEKTQTIRLWKWRMMRAGQRSYIPGAGYVAIERVEPVALADLTDADAIPDGFATADALRQELSTIYGEKLAAGYQAFRVVFRVTGQTK